MISYLASLVQFSPAAGRAGLCRQMSLCVGSTRPVLARQPEVWRPLHGRAAAFSLRGHSARRRSGLRKSLDRNRGLFAVWEGVASLGLSLPFTLPLPPTSSGDGAVLLWSFSVPLFCELPAVCSGRLIFSSLSHSLKKAPSDCSQGLLAGPHHKECHRLLFVPPPLAGGGCGRLGYFSAGICF